MKKKFISVLALAGFLLVGGSIVSCGGGNQGETPVEPPIDKPDPDKPDPEQPTPTPGAKEYLFEAEETDLSEKAGSGISGAQAGAGMVGEFPKASKGLAVGFLHTKGVSVDYVIKSDKAAKAIMSVSLGNELASMELKPGVYDIEVNGTKIKYNKFKVKGVGQTGTEFEWKTINPQIDLVAGENTIKFITGDNEYCNGGSGAPILDCLKLSTEAKLDWTPFENI